jgi:hypothetical protein
MDPEPAAQVVASGPPEILGYLLLGLLIWYAALVYLGTYVADQKGRPQFEGFMLALLFGPLGVAVVAWLPTLGPPAPKKPPKPQGRDRPARQPVARPAPVPKPTGPRPLLGELEE